MTADLDALIADNRKWVQLHRENKYQQEAATRMARVLDALEADHKRAEIATGRVIAIAVERDELRAVIAEAKEAATHTMHPEQLPTRCGVCRIERLLSEYDKQKEV